ncbi:MAG: zinc-binding dehydrogenase [Cyanobacteria bacterium P01_G01_bin.38]
MKRIVMNSDALGGLDFTDVDRPTPLPHQSLVRVVAFSLNRGEINFAQSPASKGRTIGWDYVGIIELSAADGTGLKKGTRVVGWRTEMDAFAEYVIGDSKFLAPIPDTVSDTQAAALPVAGLTALAAIDKGDRILGRSALITGVTGGVGYFALQLAKLSGARTVAQVRRSEQATFARDIGADAVVVTADGQGLDAEGPYHLVVDGIGGSWFGPLLRVTAKGGILVSYGSSGSNESRFNLSPDLYGNGGQRRIYGLTLYSEIEIEPSSVALGRLLQLVESDRLALPDITTADWSETPKLAGDLLARRFSGKAVMTIG